MAPPSDRFRPRLPLDPFTSIDAAQPWRIPASLPHSPPQVVLVLGEPRPADLLPLLSSPHLSRSLLLLATHAPPCIPALPPSAPGPALRVLRLPAPLAAHNSGALRLVSLFERAANVARLWRHSSSDSNSHHRIIQLAEEVSGGEFTAVEQFVYAAPHSKPVPSSTALAPGPHLGTQTTPTIDSNNNLNPKYPSPAPSIASYASYSSYASNASSASTYTPLPSTTSLPSRTPTQRKKLHRTQSGFRRLMKDSLEASNAHPDPNARRFDALINFLPNLPDKALLKHAILVSTLGAQYLSAPSSPAFNASHSAQIATHNPISRAPSRRFSSFSFAPSPSSSASALPLSSTPEDSPCPSPPLLPHHEGEITNDNFTWSSGKLSNANGAHIHKVKSKGSRMSLLNLLRAPPPSASSPSASPSVSEPEYQAHTHSPVGRRTSTLSRAAAPQSPSPSPSASEKTRNAHLVHVLPPGWTLEEVGVEVEVEVMRSQERERERRRRQTYAPAQSSSLRPLEAEAALHPPPGLGGARRTSSVPLLALSWQGAQSGVGARRTPEKPKLVQGVEQFLLAFAYPLGNVAASSPSSSALSPSSSLSPYPPSPASEKGKAKEEKRASHLSSTSTHGASGTLALAESQSKPVPYLLAPGVWGRAVHGTRGGCREEDGGLTVGEVVLLGALDFDHTGNGSGGSGRAWVGSVDDVVVVGGDERREETYLGPEGVLGRRELEKDKEEALRERKDTEKKRKRASAHGLPTPPETSSSEEGGEDDEDDSESNAHTGVLESPARSFVAHWPTRMQPHVVHAHADAQPQSQLQPHTSDPPLRAALTRPHTSDLPPLRVPPLVAGGGRSRAGRRVSGSVDGHEGEYEGQAVAASPQYGYGSVRSQRSASIGRREAMEAPYQYQQPQQTPTLPPGITLVAPSPAQGQLQARQGHRSSPSLSLDTHRRHGLGDGGDSHKHTGKDARRRSVVSLVVGPVSAEPAMSGTGKKHGGGFGAVLRRFGIRWGSGSGNGSRRVQEIVG